MMRKRKSFPTIDKTAINSEPSWTNSMDFFFKIEEQNYHMIHQFHGMEGEYEGNEIIVSKRSCTTMFITALFTITQN